MIYINKTNRKEPTPNASVLILQAWDKNRDLLARTVITVEGDEVSDTVSEVCNIVMHEPYTVTEDIEIVLNGDEGATINYGDEYTISYVGARFKEFDDRMKELEMEFHDLDEFKELAESLKDIVKH